jgi:hypothetical protein
MVESERNVVHRERCMVRNAIDLRLSQRDPAGKLGAGLQPDVCGDRTVCDADGYAGGFADRGHLPGEQRRSGAGTPRQAFCTAAKSGRFSLMSHAPKAGALAVQHFLEIVYAYS